MVRYFALLTLVFGITAHAGGIGFKSSYVGTHPISGGALTLTFNEDRTHASFSAERSIGRGQDLKVNQKYRDLTHWVDAVYTLNDSESGKLVAQIIITGDCQEVQNLVLKFNSGVLAKLTAVPDPRP